MLDADLTERLRPIRLIAMDVDGVLTEGGITWGGDAAGGLIETKTFNVKDGLGISLALAAGLEIAWITGRTSAIVARRAAELRVREVHQQARDKRVALGRLMERLGLDREAVLYVGDDLNDLPAFEVAGVAVAVADATATLRRRADWVTDAAGGAGAVREIIETVLQSQDRLDAAVAAFLDRLRQEQSAPLH